MPLGVIFDWDGVVIDSSRQHEKSWERLAAELDKPLPENHFKQGFGRKNQWIFPNLLKWTEDPEVIEQYSIRKEELYREIVKEDGLDALPGAVALVTALKEAGIPRAIGSSTPRVNIDTILPVIGLEGMFEAVISADDVTQGKPHPEVFLKAASAIDREPAACVVIEDATFGLEAARAGSMKLIAVTTSNPREALGMADIIVDSLEEVSIERIQALIF